MILRVAHGHVLGVGWDWDKRGGAGGGGRSPPTKENRWLDMLFRVTWAAKESSWLVMIFRVAHGHVVMLLVSPSPPTKKEKTVGWTTCCLGLRVGRKRRQLAGHDI